jgi:TRAP-type C4-dicarboxylate transport system permease small subunit
MIAVNLYGIACRYLFNRPILYVQELTILAAVWLFFIGMGLVFKMGANISVEFVVKALPKRLRVLNVLFVDLVVLFFVVILALNTYRFIPIIRGTSDSPVLSFALGLPDEIYYYPVGLGAISIFLTVSFGFFEHLAEFRSSCKNGTDVGEGTN